MHRRRRHDRDRPGRGRQLPGSAIVGQINSGALSVGGFTIATNVAQTTPYLGSAGTPILDLTFSAVTSDNQSHTIYLYASATGYTGQGPFLLTLGGTQPPPGTGNSITGMAFGGTSNTNLNFANMIASVTSTATPFALSTTGVFAPSLNPYGLTIGVAITRAAPGTTTGDLHFSIGAVPEPDPLSLLGIGIGGLLAATCLRRRAAARA